MIVVGGKEFITLDDELFVNGQKVRKAYVNGSLVYPDITLDGSVAVCSGKTTISIPGTSFPGKYESGSTAYLDGGTATTPGYTFTGSFKTYIFHNGGIRDVGWCGFIPYDRVSPDGGGYPVGWPGTWPQAYGLSHWPNAKLITGKFIDAQLVGRWENHNYYDNAEIYTFIKFHAPNGRTVGSSGYYLSGGSHGEWRLKSLNNKGAAEYNDNIIVYYQTHDNRWDGTWYSSTVLYAGEDTYVHNAWTGDGGNDLKDALSFSTGYEYGMYSSYMQKVMPEDKSVFNFGVEIRGRLNTAYESDFDDWYRPLDFHDTTEDLSYIAGYIPITQVHYVGPLEDVPKSINKGNRMFEPLKWFDPSEL